MKFVPPLLAVAFLWGCGQDEPFEPRTGPEPTLLSGVARVELYSAQPQVADVVVSLEVGASVTVEVAGDDGVRPETVVKAAGGEARVRIRGLLPETTYEATLVATGEGGAEQRVPLSFRTLEPRPGFIAQFQTERLAEGSKDYRLFDLCRLPTLSECGLFVVDPNGTTRFYLPANGALPPNLPFRPPAAVKLLADGTLMYLQDGDLFVVDELGRLRRVVRAQDVGDAGFHHDVITLPNGNLLVIGLEFDTFTLAADGQDYYYAGDTLTEIAPDGKKVWGWSSFAHLDVQRVVPDFFTAVYHNPLNDELGADWTHGNGVIHRASDDTLLLSLRHQDWMVAIDRKTGSVRWKLGEGGDFALTSGSWFYHPHSPEWQPDGSLVLYDNGLGNPHLPLAEQSSRPVRYRLDEKAMTVQQEWEETQETFLSPIASDVDRTTTDTYLILDSTLPVPGAPPGAFSFYSRLREVDPVTNEWLWTMRTLDDYFAYRAQPVTRLPGVAQP